MTATVESDPLVSRDGRYAELLGELREISANAEEDEATLQRAVDRLTAGNFTAYRVPTEFGGLGGTITGLLEIVSDLAEINPNLPHVLRTHFAFVESRIRSTRTDERAHWLRRVAEGATFANLNTELGSRSVGSRTTYETALTRTDAGLVLNGTKFYSTGSPYVDYLSVSATGPDGTVVNVVVPRDRPGVRLVGDWDGFGQRLTGSGTTVLDNVAVTDDEVIAVGEGSGEENKYYVLGQIFILAMQVGILRNTVADGIALVRRRTRTFSNAASSSPTTDPQLIAVLGELEAVSRTAGLLVGSAARAKDAAVDALVGRRDHEDLAREFALRIAKAKLYLDKHGLAAVNTIFDLGGASATRGIYNLDRHWRNYRTVSTHNPAATKARVIGEYLVGGREGLPALW